MSSADEIKKAEESQGSPLESYEDSHFSPVKNPDVISIIKQQDGNFKCYGQKNDKVVEVRGVKPEDCLVEFLTQG